MAECRFREVRRREQRRFRCQVCGRPATARRTFIGTQNPWNVDPATGAVRTVPEIREALRVEAAGWQPDRHPSCPGSEAPADATLPLFEIGGAA